VQAPAGAKPAVAPNEQQRSLVRAAATVNAVQAFGPDNEVTYQVDRKAHQVVIRVVNSKTGQLINQSGQIVNVAHVLGTFYDKDGHVVWIADQYVDQALLPQTPVPFQIHIPEDLARTITSQRTVIATYQAGGNI